DSLDRRDHHAGDRRSGRRRRRAEREGEPAAGLGGARGECVSPPRPQPGLFEELTGSLRPTSSEPAEELLGAVADEEQTDRDARQEAKQSHAGLLLPTVALET